MIRRRHRRDEGVSIVEAAFALPILLTFIFGLVDLGMWTFNANQATNAARDGARHAILDFGGADVPGSAAHDAVVDAVRSRLENDKVDSVEVSCVRPDGTAVVCSAALDDIDSVKVEVSWSWNLVTPVAAILGYDRGDAVGSATMRLVGRPLPPSSAPPPDSGEGDGDDDGGGDDETPAPTPCAVTHLKLEEPSGGVKRHKIRGDHTGQLQDPIPVIFTTNGADGCNDLRVQLLSTDARIVEIGCGCDLEPPNPPNHRWSYDGSDNVWFSAGDAYARVLNGSTKLAEYKFNVK